MRGTRQNHLPSMSWPLCSAMKAWGSAGIWNDTVRCCLRQYQLLRLFRQTDVLRLLRPDPLVLRLCLRLRRTEVLPLFRLLCTQPAIARSAAALRCCGSERSSPDGLVALSNAVPHFDPTGRNDQGRDVLRGLTRPGRSNEQRSKLAVLRLVKSANTRASSGEWKVCIYRAHGALLGRGIDGVRDGVGHFLANKESPKKLAGRKGVRLRQSVFCFTIPKSAR